MVPLLCWQPSITTRASIITRQHFTYFSESVNIPLYKTQTDPLLFLRAQGVHSDNPLKNAELPKIIKTLPSNHSLTRKEVP